jgi:putative aminopeptidase FrvX
MNTDKLDRLKEILSVPSYSGDESRMISYLKGVLDEQGYDHTIDEQGNIYVTKGVSEAYPLFVAHTDTVHRVNENLRIKEYTHNGDGHVDKLALTGFDSTNDKPSGCGGDDKCGVYLALEMLDTYDNVKAAFFISEEIGCIGSRGAVKTNPEFFENVGYAIQYDSPEGNSLSSTLMGKYLFESSDVFTDKVGGLIREHGITEWANHPYTDIWPLMDTFDFCCLNLAAGYYRYHTKHEYVIVDDVQNGYDLGIKLVETLGETKYVRPDKSYSYTYPTRGTQSTSRVQTNTGTQVLVERVEITPEEETRMDDLQVKSLHDWSEGDWVFYDDYTERKWVSHNDNDDDDYFG